MKYFFFNRTIIASLFLLINLQLHAQGFLKADGKKIVNEKGENVLLRGAGLGGWMLQEGYMIRIHNQAQQHRIRQRLEELTSPQQVQEFYVIKGLANGNFLTGGKGNDTLSGASFSQDIFFFATGDGKDTITNFVEGQFADLLDVSKWHSITDFDDLMAHHVKNVAGGVMIFAGDDSVTLDGLHKANLVEDNFVF